MINPEERGAEVRPITNMFFGVNKDDPREFFLIIKTYPDQEEHFRGPWSVFYRLRRQLLDLPDSEPQQDPL